MAILQQADRLISKTKRLVEENIRWKQKAEQLESEKAMLREKIEADAAEIASLSENIKIIKLARNISSGDSENERVTELKRKINEYIKEIDTCIAMLKDDDGREKWNSKHSSADSR